jgi:hypothetical protein
MSDEQLDQLIDDVARQITRGQLSSDFRARVVASLDRRARRAWWTSWIAVPLGAMAVTMIALAVARPFKGRDPGAERPALRQSSQAVKTETAPAAPTPPTTTVRLPASPPGGFGETGKADTTYEGRQQGTPVAAAGRRRDLSSDAATAIDALAPPPLEPAPIGLAALGIEVLPTESIAVRQLDAIAPIVVDPLPTDNARPPDGDERRPSDGGQSGVRVVSDPGLRSGP